MRVDTGTGLVMHRGVLSRSMFAVRVLQVINFLFGLIYTVLTVRFVLEYIGARRGAGFVRFIDAVTDPVYRPFQGVIPNGSDGAGHPIVWSLVVAIVAFALLHAALHGLVRLLSRPAIVEDEDY